jgi:hypothetical protein
LTQVLDRPVHGRLFFEQFGFRAALFFYSPLQPPPAPRPVLPGLRAVDAPLKRAFDRIETQVNTWIGEAQFAA